MSIYCTLLCTILSTIDVTVQIGCYTKITIYIAIPLCYNFTITPHITARKDSIMPSLQHINYLNAIILAMELTGTIAFASSGAMLAIQKQMDLFGVCVLGVTTSVGGGLIRDLLLGIIPPNMFRKPIYTIIAVLTSIILFSIIYTRRNRKNKKIAEAYNRIMLIFDTIGLGIFTVVGINTGRNLGYEQVFLLIFLGVITGVGGGLLRDIMAQEMPYILTKHIYACASILGAAVCVITGSRLGDLWSMTAGMIVVLLIRFLATYYRWNLPKIQNNNDREKP